MKIHRFLTKVWPCLCLIFYLWLSSGTVLKSSQETTEMVSNYSLTVHIKSENGQEQLLEALSTVHVKSMDAVMPTVLFGSPIQFLAVNIATDNPLIINLLQSKLTNSDLNMTSFVKLP